MNIPKDPILLMSYLNTKLRDEYPSFTELCKAMGLNPEEIEQKLQAAGFTYRPEQNQFR